MRLLIMGAAMLATALLGTQSNALAEATSLRAAKQFGLGYVQYMIMEDQKLVEKHAKAAGLGDVTVEWNTFRSSDVMNDALISGAVEFVSLGIPGLITIWDRTKGNLGVMAASGLNALPLNLMVRGDIKSLRDFKPEQKIALPAAKVSNQAILLQMAAEKEWGVGNHTQLDANTISMAHPDATIAMVGGNQDIVANFSSIPFQGRQAKTAGVKKLTSSTEIIGGPFTFNVVATTSKFRADNPKLYKAFLDALGEATALVNADKPKTAEIYARVSKDKTPADEIVALLSDPENQFTTKVASVDNFIAFMVRTGNFKNKPQTTKDLLFPEAALQ
jgi:NitT/TauT family transport system substrate-binding protein